MSEPTAEEIIQARRYWAEKTGLPFEKVPEEVVYLDMRPLTPEEEEWARETYWACNPSRKPCCRRVHPEGKPYPRQP